MPRKAFAASMLVACLLAAACAPRSPVPDTFPKDFPVPPGRVIVVEDEKPGQVGFVVEAALAVHEVPAWYEKKLVGTAWRSASEGAMFAVSEDLSTATLTNGTRTVAVLVTDLGNTTKVSLTAAVP